jgi:hypothetical protein
LAFCRVAIWPRNRTDVNADENTHTHTHRHTDTQTHRETERQRDRDRERERETFTHTHTHTHTHAQHTCALRAFSRSRAASLSSLISVCSRWFSSIAAAALPVLSLRRQDRQVSGCELGNEHATSPAPLRSSSGRWRRRRRQGSGGCGRLVIGELGVELLDKGVHIVSCREEEEQEGEREGERCTYTRQEE